MPIYAYRCEACGFAKDVLQKISDAQLTDCLACGKPAFKKQLTAAGFQLKGSGWYATDFKGGTSAPAAAAEGADAPAKTDSAAPAGTGTTTTAPAAGSTSTSASTSTSSTTASPPTTS
jgi:putative FmdB family regulatory protein